MRRIKGLSAAVILLAAVGYGVASMMDSAPSAPAPQIIAPVAAQSPAVSTARAASDEERMIFRRVQLETGGDMAEACLLFSRELDASGKTRYADYVRLPTLPDKETFGFRVDKKRLCISGMAFGDTYETEILSGFPSADGAKLEETQKISLSFGDRDPLVSLASGFILPRENAEGLPITTVNVNKLDVAIFRVGDRLLSQMRTDLLDERTLYSWRLREVGDETGRKIWQGAFDVSGEQNAQTVSLFPLAEKIGKPEPGVYLVAARDMRESEKARASQSDYDYEDGEYYDYGGPGWAAQWVVQSDLGLTYFQGQDGMTVVVRSLKTAKPVPGVELTLIARNNDELGKAKTGEGGVARFPAGLLRGEGGLVATMIMAYAGGDFNFADLRRQSFDLSDRGVSGRAPSGPVDAFLYTERGIYRPGETVHLAAMLRDPAANALEEQKAVIRVFRPDGKEYRRFTLENPRAGVSALDIPVPSSAARGTWTASAHIDPEGPSVGSVGFEVQDFVPQRLALDISKSADVLRPGTPLSLGVDARFLYGAPAADLKGEGEITLAIDPNPFPAYKGYSWGVEGESYSSERKDLDVPDTDAKGHTSVEIDLSWAKARSSHPLRAEISVAIMEPGGRSTSSFISVPVRPRDVELGIKPRFDGYAKRGQDALFDIIAVDSDGKRIALDGVKYRLFEDVSTWQWYRSGSRWSYQRISREREIGQGTLKISATDPATLAKSFDWGRYRLEVSNPAGDAVASISFYSGWYGESSADRPDRLTIAADKAGYKVGETATLHIDAEKGGQALVVVANERIHEVMQVAVAAGGSDIEIEMKPEWGAGAYALVTLYRPLGDVGGHEPVRAVGAAWLGLDPAQRTLSVAIDAPDKIAPRQTISIPIAVSGAASKAFVTLAAVDQGILQLTSFKTPQPHKYYLSKRTLGVEMRDDYSRLIRGLPSMGDDQGGDGVGGAGLEVVPTRTVALFSGIVALDGDGKAEISLEIPEFQGELRLMAVAWDAGKTGSSDKRMTVRDPLVADVILPRFLAPEDKGLATVLIHNVDGAPGDYKVSLALSGAIGGDKHESTLSLPVGKREIYTVPISGKEAGIGSIDLVVDGPSFHVAKDWSMQVRPPQLPETRETVAMLSPGKTELVDQTIFKGYVPGTAKAAVSLSRWQGMDAPGLLRWLDRYPYGCLEQTTSRAMPLLYFNDVAALSGVKKDENIEDRIQEAIDKVLSQQTESGAFRMWSGNWGNEAYPWLSVFTLDFLFRAQEKGYDVPQAPLNLGKRWLAASATKDGDSSTRAYAYAILARHGRVNASDLRYFYDHNRSYNPLALAHVGSALEAIGERARATEAFSMAQTQLTRWSRLAFEASGYWRPNPSPKQRSAQDQLARYETAPYGSLLRDTFGVVVELTASGRSAQVPALLEMAGAYDTRADYTTTQEKAWMLLAIADLSKNAGQLAVEIDGVKTDKGDPISVSLTDEQIARGVKIANVGEGDVFKIVSTEGAPSAPLPPFFNNISLEKTILTLDGRPADLSKVTRNDRLIVVISGFATGRQEGEYAILDLLPAGWDIEALLRPKQPGYDWIGELSEAQTREARDDRMVAVVKLPNNQSDYYYDDRDSPKWTNEWEFRVAYVVRAVTPGSFTLPAATIEHMYRPRTKARTELDRLVVEERK